jgi:hypothetical protein
MNDWQPLDLSVVTDNEDHDAINIHRDVTGDLLGDHKMCFRSTTFRRNV